VGRKTVWIFLIGIVEKNSAFSKAIWHCQYHFVFIPKFRFKILEGAISKELDRSIRSFCSQQKCEVFELNIQIDHVHLLVMVPLKISVSDFMGVIKGRSAVRILVVL